MVTELDAVLEAANAGSGKAAAAFERLAVRILDVAKRVRLLLVNGVKLSSKQCSGPVESQWAALVRKAKARDSSHFSRQRKTAWIACVEANLARIGELNLATLKAEAEGNAAEIERLRDERSALVLKDATIAKAGWKKFKP